MNSADFALHSSRLMPGREVEDDSQPPELRGDDRQAEDAVHDRDRRDVQ